MNETTHTHSTRCWWDHTQARWACDADRGPAATPVADDDRPLVDVRDMLVVHTALLREFRLVRQAVARVPAGATRRVRAVDRHLGLLCDLLHHHHAGEDALLWPKLHERLPSAAALHVVEVEVQHAAIETALHRVRDARLAWAADAAAGSRDALVEGLHALSTLLTEHLELEERSVLPLAAAVLTEAEWAAVGEEAVASTPKPTLVLELGMFAYEGDPAVLRAMIASAPTVPRLLLPRIAPRVYARRARKVYGTSRP